MRAALPWVMGRPSAVQSMTNTPTEEIAATVEQIHRLEAAGCEIVRVAVPDETAARAIAAIKNADCHPPDCRYPFRLPPGIAGPQRRRRPAHQSRQHRRPRQAREGCGSSQGASIAHSHRCQRRVSGKGSAGDGYNGATPQAMVDSAMRHVALLEAWISDRSRFPSRHPMFPARWRLTACWQPQRNIRCTWVLPRPGPFMPASSNRRWASACCWPRASATPAGQPDARSGGRGAGGL
jgi:hypothetical protein